MTSQLVRVLTVALALNCVLDPRSAAAQAPVQEATTAAATPEQDRAARGLFDAGTLAFREGRYEAALHHFEEAHRLSQRPLLWFNIASSLDRLRRDEDALAAFERYLEELPQAPNHQAVEARIELLRAAIAHDTAQRAEVHAEAQAAAETAAAQREASAPVVARVESMPERAVDGLPPVVFWVGVGVTGALAVVSTWSGFDTSSANDDYLDAPTKRAYDDAHARQSRTNVLVGVTAALAATSLVLALLTDWGGSDEQGSEPMAQAWVGPDGAGLVVQGKL